MKSWLCMRNLAMWNSKESASVSGKESKQAEWRGGHSPRMDLGYFNNCLLLNGLPKSSPWSLLVVLLFFYLVTVSRGLMCHLGPGLNPGFSSKVLTTTLLVILHCRCYKVRKTSQRDKWKHYKHIQSCENCFCSLGWVTKENSNKNK